MMKLQNILKCLSISIPLVLFSGTIIAEPSNSESNDLQLHSETNKQTVYLKPGVNFSDYQSINIEEVSITFKKNWLRNYNRDKKSLSNKLNEKDINIIKNRFSKQFMKSFTKKLSENTGYSIVSNHEQGTLLLKPSMIDMEINGPDIIDSSAKIILVRSAGEATLSLEVYDAKTDTLLGTMISRRKAREYYDLHQASLIFNKIEFIPIFNYWAKNFLEAFK